ncbi:MAG: hypothetical protein PWP64_1522 [Candidatus Cloacimonadota bacterium]|nr:hypothetical protein [Candidatus Cloacimonadota bacterium]
MKKFILPLMVLLFVGSLFAVESAPSEVVGYVKYDLLAGNNTIALPMDQPYELASEIGDAIGATTVAYFNASTQVWERIDAFPWGGWSGDFNVTNGQALWISIDAEASFYSLGNMPETLPVYNLLAGNNMIMVPLNRSDLNLASLVGNDIGATTVAYFNSSTQIWERIDAFPWGGWSGDFDTAIGDPLWVSTDIAGTWPAPAGRAIQSKSAKK